MIKVLYKPLSLLLGVLAGVIASKAFEQVWKRIDPENQAPQPTQQQAGWGKVLLSSALQGAIYAGVKAAVSRGGAQGVQKATGTWPGETADAAA